MGPYISVELRRFVYERANACCEYCLIPDVIVFAAFELDHIIAQKHGGKTESANLALSCSLCNKFKGSDLSSIDYESGNLVAFFNPRQDNWHDHFQLSDARILPLTATDRVTE